MSGYEPCQSLSSNNERQADVPYVPYVPTSVAADNVPYLQVVNVGDSVATPSYTPFYSININYYADDTL